MYYHYHPRSDLAGQGGTGVWCLVLDRKGEETRRGSMGRPPCCDKANVKKGLWTPEEDAKLLAYTSNHGTGNWTSVPQRAGRR